MRTPPPLTFFAIRIGDGVRPRQSMSSLPAVPHKGQGYSRLSLAVIVQQVHETTVQSLW